MDVKVLGDSPVKKWDMPIHYNINASLRKYKHWTCEKGIISHEIGHSLGFWHEHARADRDAYVKINESNIMAGQLHNFQKISWATIDNIAVQYDISSVMHYNALEFSEAAFAGRRTIESLDPFMQNSMGQQLELSFYDVKLANKAYCNTVCDPALLHGVCNHDGYQDPRNCSRCRCPEGLSGDFCDTVTPSTGSCGGVITRSDSTNTIIQSPGYPTTYAAGLKCYWLIQVAAAKTCSLDNTVTWLASCANVAIFLNDTINSQPEICRVYSESLYCMQHNARAHGLVCSDSDIVQATRIILGQSAKANFDNCNLTPEQGTLCSPDRLGPFALVTCRILLAQQVEFGAKNCMLSQYFLQCVNNQLKFAGTVCSPMEVQAAMDTPTSVDWLHRNYPSLNMSKCFYTTSDGGQNECADSLSVLSANKAALKCVGTIAALDKLKDDTITDAELCGVQQELEYCVEREVRAGGHTCTSDQVSNMISSYYSIALGSSSNKTILGNCHENTPALNTSICSDAERLSNYVAVFSHAYLTYVPHPVTADFCKTFTDSVKDRMAILNDNCTTSAIITALTSPVGRTRLSRYTIEDLTPCVSIGQ